MGRNNELSGKAGGTLRCCSFAKIDTTADNQYLQAGSGDVPCGITPEWMNAAPGIAGSDSTTYAITGEYVALKGPGDDCLIITGTGGCTAGDFLKPDTSGYGVTASSTDKVGAEALETVTAGAKARVRVLPAGSKAP